MSHIAAPHVIDQLGFVGGIVAVLCALYLRFGYEKRVPPLLVEVPVIVGVALLFHYSEALTELPARTVISLRVFVIIGAWSIGPGIVLWVRKNIDTEECPEDELREALETLERAMRRRVKRTIKFK